MFNRPNPFPWIALFSQSGSEILALTEKLEFKPSIILTNNLRMSWVSGIDIFKCAPHDELMEWLRLSYPDNTFRNEKVLITLHGYLRIIPEDICMRYKNIYNGHPGAIDLYPELKGKDPQEKVWNNNEKYRIIGSVVHEVVPEVDGGEIVSASHYTNRNDNLKELMHALKVSSLDSWYWFMKRKIKELCA